LHCCRLSKEHSNRELQHVVVSQADRPSGSTKGSKLSHAAASAAVLGEDASQLAAGQQTAVPAVLSTEAAASAVVGTGAGVTRRRGWFGRRKDGEGKDVVAVKGDGEYKPKDVPVKVGVWHTSFFCALSAGVDSKVCTIGWTVLHPRCCAVC
jgi:hypothetical protein